MSRERERERVMSSWIQLEEYPPLTHAESMDEMNALPYQSNEHRAEVMVYLTIHAQLQFLQYKKNSKILSNELKKTKAAIRNYKKIKCAT